MDYISLIACEAAFLVACWLDVSSSLTMTKYKIREGNKLVRDGNGNFSLTKALLWVVGPALGVALVFFLGPDHDASGYDRAYAGPFLLLGAAAHLYAWRSNTKLIAKKKAAGVIPGGVL
jgi:hypothetical protein